ncbi:MAG: MBL fold metallo-hydrolase, partial [Deltaproteobacteria bacterium]|nr:MBL fold metallo-hydrolase [Deltaproteobacteria bacterium]
MSELIFRQIEIGPMANYSYLIGSSASREAVLVDPAWDVAALRELVRKEGLSLTGILVTHTHFDHVGGEMSGQRIEGVPELLKLCAPDKPRLYVHPKEAGQIPDGGEERVETSDGFVLMLGGVAIEFIHTPGHSPGSQCFRVEGRLV